MYSLVTIRARLRMGVALLPARRHIYDRRISSACPHDSCHGAHGDATHVLLNCPRFAAPRLTLSHALQSRLRVKVALSLGLLHGQPPPEAGGFPHKTAVLMHRQCLDLTGDFLLCVNRVMKL